MKYIYILGIILGFFVSVNSLYAVESFGVEITSPARASVPGPVTVLTNNEVSLAFTITGGTPISCWYDLGDEEKFTLEGCNSKIITLQNGDYTLNFYAENEEGELALDSSWFSVKAPLVVDIVIPKDKAILANNQVEINFTTNGNPTSCWYDLGGLKIENGIVIDANDPTYKYELPNCEGSTITLPVGDYVLNLWALDESEGEALDSHWFSVVAPTNEINDKPKEKNRRSSGSIPGRVLGALTSDEGRVLGALTSDEGRVLGASTSSCQNYDDGVYVNKYLRRGYNNDVEAVKRVQKFLNEHMKAELIEDGFYGLKTELAVKEYQRQNASTVLAPWNISDPTGIFYITTQFAVNNMVCSDLKLSSPNPEKLISFSKNNLAPKKK